MKLYYRNIHGHYDLIPKGGNVIERVVEIKDTLGLIPYFKVLPNFDVKIILDFENIEPVGELIAFLKAQFETSKQLGGILITEGKFLNALFDLVRKQDFNIPFWLDKGAWAKADDYVKGKASGVIINFRQKLGEISRKKFIVLNSEYKDKFIWQFSFENEDDFGFFEKNKRKILLFEAITADFGVGISKDLRFKIQRFNNLFQNITKDKAK